MSEIDSIKHIENAIHERIRTNLQLLLASEDISVQKSCDLIQNKTGVIITRQSMERYCNTGNVPLEKLVVIGNTFHFTVDELLSDTFSVKVALKNHHQENQQSLTNNSSGNNTEISKVFPLVIPESSDGILEAIRAMVAEKDIPIQNYDDTIIQEQIDAYVEAHTDLDHEIAANILRLYLIAAEYDLIPITVCIAGISRMFQLEGIDLNTPSSYHDIDLKISSFKSGILKYYMYRALYQISDYFHNEDIYNDCEEYDLIKLPDFDSKPAHMLKESMEKLRKEGNIYAKDYLDYSRKQDKNQLSNPDDPI